MKDKFVLQYEFISFESNIYCANLDYMIKFHIHMNVFCSFEPYEITNAYLVLTCKTLISYYII